MTQTDSPEPTEHDPYAAFRHAAFRIYVSSYALAVISSLMLSFAAKFEVNELTRSQPGGAARYLGLLGGVGAVPILGLSLFAGHAVDRFSRKHLLMLTQMILTICPALFALIVKLHLNNVWAVYGIVLANGTALAFARPARASLIGNLVPRADFGSAVTWNSSIFEMAGILAPAIAGLLVGAVSLTAALLVSSTCMAACTIISIALPNPTVALPAAGGTRPGWHSLLAGVRFVMHTRLLFAVMALDLFAVLLGGATYVMPIFADRLGVGARGLGWMMSAPAVGAITMALIQAHRKPFSRAGPTMMFAVVGFGLATIVFGLSHTLWVTLPALALLGACDNVSVIVRHSLVQLLTPDAMRGRVTAVNQVFIGASNELGGVESGVTAALFGPVASVVAGGIGVIGVVIGIAIRYPEVRRLGRLADVEPGRLPDDADPAQQNPTQQSPA